LFICGLRLGLLRGAAKRKRRPPPVKLPNPNPPTRHPTYFSWLFFSTFLGVSRQGEFKNTIKLFVQKVHVENFSQNQNNRQKIQCQFSSTFFVLSCFRVFLSDGVQKHYKKRFAKKSCRKAFTKKSTKNPKLKKKFSIFFHYVFGRFSVRGVQKHDKNLSNK
jgi:hypothetical protein